MRWVLSLVAVTLLTLGGTAYAGPDEGEKAPGGECDGCEVSQTEVSQTVADEQATTVQMTLMDVGEHGGKQVKLALSGPWQDVPEATRERLLSKLKEMLPEPAFKQVLKQLVAGERTIKVAVATAQPKAAAIPAIRLRPAIVGGGAGAAGTVGTVPAGGVMRVMSEEDLEKLPPEIRKQIEVMKASGTAPRMWVRSGPGAPLVVKAEPAGNQVRVVAVKPQGEVEKKVEIVVKGADGMEMDDLPPELMKHLMKALEGQVSGEMMEEIREAIRTGHDGRRVVIGRRMGPGQGQGRGRGGPGAGHGRRRNFDGADGEAPRGMRGGRGGRGGPGGRVMPGGRGGQPGPDGGNPLLKAMEELTREIRGLRSDLRNMHRPPTPPAVRRSNASGNFRIQGLAPGQFRVMVAPTEGGKAEGDDDDDAEELEEEIEELEEELEAELQEIREDLKRMMKEIESLRSK